MSMQVGKVDQLVRKVCLQEELIASRELIKSGFGHLQEIDIGNTFYALPHQLIASGLERLMKCYLSLVHKADRGMYPDQYRMKEWSHDLTALLEEILANYFGGTRRPIIANDLHFMKTDCILRESIRILSIFGEKGRYYNLNVVTSGKRHYMEDPQTTWQALERKIENPIPYLKDPEILHRDYYPRVHSQIISKLERLIRAVVMQLTLGDHIDPHRELKSAASLYTEFLMLQDDEFGTIDYRRSVEILKASHDKWTKSTEKEITDSKWPTLRVSKASFKGDWPFRHDAVTIEMRNQLFAIVHVASYAFSLNGSAKGHLKYPNPHDAGVAIFGKSIQPFIDMAWKLLD